MDPATRQANVIAKALRGEAGTEFEGYLRIICCVEDPIDSTLTDVNLDGGQVMRAVKIDPTALAVRQGKQAVYAELMHWVRRAERPPEGRE